MKFRLAGNMKFRLAGVLTLALAGTALVPAGAGRRRALDTSTSMTTQRPSKHGRGLQPAAERHADPDPRLTVRDRRRRCR